MAFNFSEGVFKIFLFKASCIGRSRTALVGPRRHLLRWRSLATSARVQMPNDESWIPHRTPEQSGLLSLRVDSQLHWALEIAQIFNKYLVMLILQFYTIKFGIYYLWGKEVSCRSITRQLNEVESEKRVGGVRSVGLCRTILFYNTLSSKRLVKFACSTERVVQVSRPRPLFFHYVR